MEKENVLEQYETQGYLQKFTIHEEFQKAVAKYPDKVAVIDSQGSITYRALDAYSDALAMFFLQHGLVSDDRVLLQLPNSILYVAVLFALFKAGIIPALLLQTHRVQEVVSVAEMISPKAYIGCDEVLGVKYVDMVNSSDQCANLSIQTIFSNQEYEGEGLFPCIKLPEFQNQMLEKSFTEYEKDYRKTALFLLSGGTTNLPKIIPRIHEAYVYNSKAAAVAANVTEKSGYMAVLSTSHDYSLASPGLLGTLYQGGTVVMCETASFDESFALIEQHHVTFTCIVPAIAQVWVDVLEWYEGDFSSLENIVVGAAKLEQETAHALIEKLGIHLQQAYGLGEGIICYTSLDDPLDVILSSQGKPVSDGDEIIIVDEMNNRLPPRVPGELLEKGPYTFLGYYGNESLNEGLFTEDGFLRTGDRAYLDEEGNVTICGRVREQINRAGENVSPMEVESVLKQHPNIRDAAVFGRADENLGERTTALIITDGAELVLKDITTFFISLGVALYKVPDELHICKSFVYTNVGKVDKKKMERLLEEGETEWRI